VTQHIIITKALELSLAQVCRN